jgi:hypothetical protein
MKLAPFTYKYKTSMRIRLMNRMVRRLMKKMPYRATLILVVKLASTWKKHVDYGYFSRYKDVIKQLNGRKLAFARLTKKGKLYCGDGCSVFIIPTSAVATTDLAYNMTAYNQIKESALSHLVDYSLEEECHAASCFYRTDLLERPPSGLNATGEVLSTLREYDERWAAINVENMPELAIARNWISNNADRETASRWDTISTRLIDMHWKSGPFHGDFNSTNVMWNNNHPVLIDLMTFRWHAPQVIDEINWRQTEVPRDGKWRWPHVIESVMRIVGDVQNSPVDVKYQRLSRFTHDELLLFYLFKLGAAVANGFGSTKSWSNMMRTSLMHVAAFNAKKQNGTI